MHPVGVRPRVSRVDHAPQRVSDDVNPLVSEPRTRRFEILHHLVEGVRRRGFGAVAVAAQVVAHTGEVAGERRYQAVARRDPMPCTMYRGGRSPSIAYATSIALMGGKLASIGGGRFQAAPNAAPFGRMRIPGRSRVHGSAPGSATIGPGATQISTSEAMGSKSALK